MIAAYLVVYRNFMMSELGVMFSSTGRRFSLVYKMSKYSENGQFFVMYHKEKQQIFTSDINQLINV